MSGSNKPNKSVKPTKTVKAAKSTKARNSQERIDSLGIQKPRLVQWWIDSDKTDVAGRVLIAAAAAITLLIACVTWRPPLAYRVESIPPRDLITRVTFEVVDKQATETARNRKKSEQLAFYRNRTQPLDQMRARLRDQLFLVLSAPSFDQLNSQELAVFGQFYEDSETKPADAPERAFAMLKNVFADDPELDAFDEALQIAMRNNYKFGLLQSLQHSPEQGNQQRIRVYPENRPDDVQFVELDEARIAQASVGLEKQIKNQFRTTFDHESSEAVAGMIVGWILPRLANYQTLTYDDVLSERSRLEAAESVPPMMTVYRTGESKLATAGEPLTAEQLGLLQREWVTLVSKMRWQDKLARVAAYGGMIIALYMLCGAYIFFVDDRRLLLEPWRLTKLVALMVLIIAGGYWLAGGKWHLELMPLTVGSIICGVVYGRELALLLMTAACVSLTLFLGFDINNLVAMAAASTSLILLMGSIRTLTHLLYIGLAAAAVTVLTVVGVGIVTGQTLSAGALGSGVEPVYRGPLFDLVFFNLLREAFRGGVCIVVSAAAMTPLLPTVERIFGVLTDLSLLKLGDPSHPLLRRLAQRAPGTYNHSITVASIAESAAEAIGANGLLVRVGSYFHDIGKMFKPEYFIENQSAGHNSHDSLQPAMSTLVIIAHVKDGADLARNHGLPESIVDLILQHHGTTLVEFFYREAAKRSEDNPENGEVSDKDFRYPGPKPQTLEAAVMMLADTVESASRTLVDPTPARIRNLVDAIAQKKMADGQFDECGLTFRQLDQIRTSLVKSLTAIYHARVKYPGQQSA